MKRIALVAQASCLWGQQASCLVKLKAQEQARRLLAPQARCLCYRHEILG